MRSTWGQPTVNLGSTSGQSGVNLHRSTLVPPAPPNFLLPALPSASALAFVQGLANIARHVTQRILNIAPRVKWHPMMW
jgi:hypothetical protein